MLDILLWPYSYCEGHQDGYGGEFVGFCQLYICEGECLHYRGLIWLTCVQEHF